MAVFHRLTLYLKMFLINSNLIKSVCVGLARRRAGLRCEWGKIRILEKFLTRGKDSEKFFRVNFNELKT